MDMQTYIRKAIDDAGLIPAEVARRLDTSPQAVNGWLTTGRISKPMLAKLALLTGKPIEYFLGGAATTLTASEPRALFSRPADKYAMIPRYQIAAGAGSGRENGHEEISGSHAYRRDWLERKHLSAEACVVIEVVGESMQPTIADGDVVLINTASRKLLNGRVFAFNTEDGVRIKRLFKQLDGRVRMVSDNQDKTLYPDDYLTPGMEVSIIGEVVHRSGGV